MMKELIISNNLKYFLNNLIDFFNRKKTNQHTNVDLPNEWDIVKLIECSRHKDNPIKYILVNLE